MMNDSSSENLIFEIVNGLNLNGVIFDRDKIYSLLSFITVKYKIVKLDHNEENCNLEDNINLYLSARKLEGLSLKTIKGYEYELKSFAKYIHINVEDITATHIRNYFSQFMNLKTSSLATKISTVKTFFGWLTQEEIIQKDPSRKIKTPKFNKRNPKYLEIDELEMLRESCKTLRQRALKQGKLILRVS